MKLSERRPLARKRSARWWVVSIAIHVVVVVLLAQMVFKYSLGQLMGIPREEMTRERIQYIVVPAPAEASAEQTTKTASPGAAPAALRAPTQVPSTIPPPASSDSARSQTAGGTGTGDGLAGSGAATGISPRAPDSRIALAPNSVSRARRTTEESVDSIVSLVIGIVNDSIRVAQSQRKPGDWTVKGDDGKVWGWDPQGNIRLGKFTIPGALLALLPLNTQSRLSPIEQRSLAYIRRDIIENAQRSINEDEFREAVKRIRERKERERRQQQLAADGTAQP
ncbi:MAG TPA: hypothetical protein VEB19_10485 [Gemmatimonadaceae bacterium]|nr:hypothetical protein [Gemmatimonadaceae bacterium]